MANDIYFGANFIYFEANINLNSNTPRKLCRVLDGLYSYLCKSDKHLGSAITAVTSL